MTSQLVRSTATEKFQAAILAIGSELLSGQILNRNAQWISSKLVEQGIVVKQHITVDDDIDEITEALFSLADKCQYIFITGGLGPTSDDLTRDAVARWCGKELVYDPASWTHIEEIFTRLGRTAPASNRQQCYFPDGADILRNRAGTANGFQITHNGTMVWVLPGPPKEVDTVWNDFVQHQVVDLVPPEKRLVTKMWRTVGLGESHVADLLSPIVTGRGAGVAYRAHAPYIETKISFSASETERFKPLCQEIDSTLSKWLFEKDDEDLATIFALELNRFTSVDIYDGATQGQISQLLAPHIKTTNKAERQVSLVTSWEPHDSPREFVEQCFAISGSTDLAVVVAGFDHAGHWAYGVRSSKGTEIVEVPSIYFGDDVRLRNQMAVAALVIKGWLRIVGQMVN